MSMIDDEAPGEEGKRRGWPGFRYTAAEWSDLKQVAEECQGSEFAVFLIVNSLLFLLLSGALVWFGMVPFLHRLYPNWHDLSPVVFFPTLGLICAVMTGVGMPLSMALAAAGVRVLYNVRQEASPVTAERIHALYRKLQWQLLRTGLLVTAGGMTLAAVLAVTSGMGQVLLLASLRILAPAAFSVVLLFLIGRATSR